MRANWSGVPEAWHGWNGAAALAAQICLSMCTVMLQDIFGSTNCAAPVNSLSNVAVFCEWHVLHAVRCLLQWKLQCPAILIRHDIALPLKSSASKRRARTLMGS